MRPPKELTIETPGDRFIIPSTRGPRGDLEAWSDYARVYNTLHHKSFQKQK